MKRSIQFWVKRFVWAFLLLQTVLVLGFSVFVSPNDIESGAVQLTKPCPSLVETGVPCATCGVTRGLCAMGHLQWVRAYNYNPISMLIFFLEVGILVWAFRKRPWRKAAPMDMQSAQD